MTLAVGQKILGKRIEFLLIILSVFCFSKLFASGEEKKDGFDAGALIMHHVQDAHSIHFFDVGESHYTLHLPIILYTEKGLDIFSSSNFYDSHHKEVPYTSEKTGLTYSLVHEKIYYGAIDTHHEGEIHAAAPLDFSITKTVAGMFLGIFLLLLIFSKVGNAYKKNGIAAPKGLQSFIEPLVVFLRDEVIKPSVGEKKYEKFTPYLLTLFFFIFVGNILGLIPFLGGLNIAGNIAVALTLAAFTFIVTSFNANAGYWKHIFMPPGVPFWLLPLMVPIEILGVFNKPIVLTLRLFANVTAGHIIILSFVSLIFIFGNSSGAGAGYGVSIISVLFSTFMNILELLVAFLQAYVFTLLSALYFGQAVEEAHH